MDDREHNEQEKHGTYEEHGNHGYFVQFRSIEYLVLEELKHLRREVKKLMSKITDFAKETQTSFDAVNASLDNIVTDEANLAKQISDLQAQIAASTSTLTPEDQAALDLIVVNAAALAAHTKSVAEAVPDLPVVPVV